MRTPRSLVDDERGMATAEYAICTVAAASFAGLLMKLVGGSEVQQLLMKLIKAALSIAS
ncbi:DUF4244 domain-containing protein [Actinopolymorpha alba]|uniref:DUF4244 domain-containing protein n=1 Tax=Actinopolymorpha alba TaxID=533267 RepID=UPI0003630C0F|nr:DUF4244 domain-containing protein [Actinopolymorpha alba]